MTLEAHVQRMPDPVPQAVLWLVVIGSTSFAAGFFGPLLFSTSNLGPLLGIFVTGPIGFLIGGLVGALRVSRRAAGLSAIFIGAVWALTLAFTYFLGALLPEVIYLIGPLHILVIASTVYLLASPTTSAQLPDGLRRSGLVVIAAQVMILATTLYLPVIRTPFGVPGDPAPVPFPSFAFVFDQGFQLSHRLPTLPQFVVNQPKLALEWLIVIGVAFVLGLLIRSPSRRRAA